MNMDGSVCADEESEQAHTLLKAPPVIDWSDEIGDKSLTGSQDWPSWFSPHLMRSKPGCDETAGPLSYKI